MFGTTRRLQNFTEVSRISNFVTVGNGVAINVTSTSSPLQFPALSENSPAGDVMIVNTGTNAAFITFANSSPTAVAPINGTPANGICIPGGAVMVLDKSFATWVAAITISSTTTIYLYQGMGS